MRLHAPFAHYILIGDKVNRRFILSGIYDLIVTEEEQILIPCFGFHTTEKNALHQPHMELSLGSDQVQGKLGMGTGFLLTGTGKFLSEGALYAQMRTKCDWIKRVLVFSPESCRQTV